MIIAFIVALVCVVATVIQGFWVSNGIHRNIRFSMTKGATNGNPEPLQSLGTLKISNIGVGTFSWFKESNDITKESSEKLIEYAVERGCNFFDAAERTSADMRWGTGEPLFYPYLQQSKIVVATKFTPISWRCNAKDVVKACEDSCKRLGVDAIDHYQIHMPHVQPSRPFGIAKANDQVYWEGLAECYKRGIAKNVGVSNYGSSLLLKAAEKFSGWKIPLVSNQINYNLLYQSPSVRKTIDTANQLGIRTIAYFPLAMGLLTGKYAKQFQDDEADMYQDSSKTYLEKCELQNRYSEVLPLLLVLKQIADARNKTITQVALNWIMCQGIIPIPGARNVAQLKENLGAQGWRLTKDEFVRLQQASEEIDMEFDGTGFKKSNKKLVGVESWSME